MAKQTGRHSVGEDRSFLRSLVFFVVKWLGLALLPLLLLRGVWGLVTSDEKPAPVRSAERTQQPQQAPPDQAASPLPATSPSPASPQAAAEPPAKLQILNGTETIGTAATLATTLRHAGHEVVSVAKARTAYPKTTILYQPGFEQSARDLAATLGGAQVQPVSADVKVSKDVPLTVIVGADYKAEGAAASASPSPGAKPPTSPAASPQASPSRSQASPTASPSSAAVQVQVLNGTDVQGLARRAADRLQAKGYLTPTIKNANNMYDRTVVYYQPGFQRNAAEVVGILGTGTVKPAPANLPKDVPLTVAIGKDYT